MLWPEHHPEAAVIIPPRVTAIASETTTTQRDLTFLETIGKHGRIGWQRSSPQCIDTKQSSVGVFTPGLLPNQRAEAKIGCNVLNRMTRLGMPVSVRIV